MGSGASEERKDPHRYMVLCVAGQSNAVGFDESPVEEGYAQHYHMERIRQLGFLPEHNLEVVPLGPCAENYQDMRPFGNPKTPGIGTKGMHLPLAELLLADIPEGYDILVLPCAYGGCGFTVGMDGSYDPKTLRPSEGQLRWGARSPFFLAMKDRISYALELNPENRFLGVVWVQGEHDHAAPERQIPAFDVMTRDFFSDMRGRHPGKVYMGDWDRDIWYNVETVAYWYGFEGCQRIWAHYRAWNPKTYVEIPRDTDSNEVNGTGITASIRAAHYGNDAFRKVVAPRVEAVMRRRLAGEGGNISADP